eukprot:Platyproteum_vivax@DN3240_c0_g1_i4.p1
MILWYTQLQQNQPSKDGTGIYYDAHSVHFQEGGLDLNQARLPLGTKYVRQVNRAVARGPEATATINRSFRYASLQTYDGDDSSNIGFEWPAGDDFADNVGGVGGTGSKTHATQEQINKFGGTYEPKRSRTGEEELTHFDGKYRDVAREVHVYIAADGSVVRQVNKAVAIGRNG